MMAYLEHRPKEKHQLMNLSGFWGGKTIADVTAQSCRQFAKARPKVAARRDLETLRAAINHWHEEYGPLAVMPKITLPEKPEARTRWLTRGDVAKILLAARRTPHLARFIEIAFYTGSRSAVILALRWDWIDFDRGIMRRRALGEADNKTKRRPPVKLGRRLLTLLRRWKQQDVALLRRWRQDPDARKRPQSVATLPVCHYDGEPVTKLRRSWATACKAAGVKASPHDLRRTRATILMSRGKDPETIAQSLGMTPEVLRSVYAQYDPDWQSDVADVDR